MENKANYIYNNLQQLFPDAKCKLEYNSHFQLLIAVVLSAQTTDKSVNNVTKCLFKKYPDAQSLAKADLNDLEQIIHNIGLFHNKAKSIFQIALKLVELYDGQVPDQFDELVKLPGVGRKTANVVLAELFNKETFAVDTHVARISKRLAIADEDDNPLIIEKKLNDFFEKDKWSKLHHLFIHFGRYKCKASKPDCTNCPFKENICTEKHDD